MGRADENEAMQKLDNSSAAPTGKTYAFPLTFQQQRLWFLDQLEPGSTNYNITWALGLNGTLSVEALEASLNEIASRHEVLRTTFPVRDGEPVQLIAEDLGVPVRHSDLSGLPGKEQDAELWRQVNGEKRGQMSLQDGPLLRALLVKLGEQNHVLLVSTHHIVFDGWSRQILIRELAALYEGFVQGKTPALPKLPLQYADFAVWQRQQLQGKALDQHISYWKEQLGGAPATLELPTDRPRPAVQTYRGTNCPLELSGALTESLKTLSRAENATLFMTLLAAFQTLLFRYSGQEDLVVGTPIANRTRPEIEPLIGFFANTLALRADLSGNPTFRDLLARVKATALGAYAHQEMPFEKIVEELRPERSLSHNPIFQVLFSLQNTPRQDFALPGLTVTLLPTDQSTSKFDLSLFMAEDRGNLSGRLEFNTDLFDEAAAARMMEHFRVLLQDIAAHPETPVSELALLNGREQRQLLTEWNETAVDFPSDRCLHQLFESAAQDRGEAIATICGDQQITYKELNRRANRLAHYLGKHGIRRGSRVGIYVERSLEMMVGLLGIQKAGAAYVPLDPAYPSKRLRTMLEDAQVGILLTQQSLLQGLPEHETEIFCLDRDWHQLAEESSENPENGVQPQDLVYVIFTSGSTGRAKGVQVTHQNVVNLLWSMRQELELSESDVIPALASFAFDMCIPELYLPLICGGKLVIVPRETGMDGVELRRLLEQRGVTLVHATPTTWGLLLDAGFSARGKKRVIGAEPLPRELFLRLMETGEPLWNFYGPTETTVWSAFQRFTSAEEAVVIGRPLANTQIYVLDPSLHPVPVGVAGEIYIGGTGVTRGYLNRPELTEEKFIRDPFRNDPEARLYKTGDLGSFLPDGKIKFLGRSDHQVKIRGFRIELGEIESALRSHPDILDSVVVVREDHPGIKRLAGYFIPREGKAPAPGELRAHLAQRLPDYMVPSAFVALEKFPLNANGKVDRKHLPAPEYGAGEANSAGARTPTEEVVSEVWAQVLHLARVGMHDNFFELGGHSLLGTQVVSRLRQIFQVELPLRALFECPTVAGVAERIEVMQRSAQGLQAPPFEIVSREAELPLSFGQQRLWFLERLEPGPLYNIPISLRLHGNLQVPVLEQSLSEIVRRHEVLRTNFRVHDEEPSQVINPPQLVRLPVEDLSKLAETNRQSSAQNLARLEAQQPFNVENDAIFRGRLLRLAADDHVLLLTVHHAAFDRWSTSVVLSELAALYRAFCAGQASPLPELTYQYADFAAWQRRYLQGETLEKQVLYWKQQLAGAPASLPLPTDRPHPATRSYRGARQTITLPKATLDDLRSLSEREGVTLFMTLLAAFNVLLARYSDQEDIVVGSPIAGRNRPEVEKLAGFFVNTLALRTDLSGDPTFQELLRRVRDVAIEAYAHQDLPFEKLVEELHLRRDLRRNPLFQVMFILQNVPEGEQEMAGLTTSPFLVETGTSKFDLTANLAEKSEGLKLTLQYNTDTFDAATITRMAKHFQILMEGVIASPETRVSELPLLSRSEMQQVVVEWNQTGVSYGGPACIHQWIEKQVERTPDNVAVVYEGQTLSYRELNSRANQLAHYLRKQGVGPDVLVAICTERSLETVIAVLAVLKAGGGYLPLDPEYPSERIALMLEDAKPRLVLTQERLLAQLPGQNVAACFCLDRDWAAIAGEESTNLRNLASGQNIAYVLYTSGSTGMPKAVPNLHQGVANQILWRQHVYGLNADDRVLQKTPHIFDVSVWEFFWTLMAGARLVVARPGGHRDPEYLVKAIREHKITTLHFVPSMLRFFLDADEIEKCSSLKRVFSGGEALTLELQNRFYERLGAELHNLYGPTETAIDVTYFRCFPGQSRAVVPIGRPVANTQLYVLDRKLHPVPIGVPGELHIGGVQLASGYLNRPELTGEKFIPDPFAKESAARLYKTGDLARYLPDGNVEYLGRMDSQVKIRGFRIELGEIETVLRSYPAVSAAVVVAREEESGDKRLVAYVVPRADGPVDAGELRTYLKSKLPEYMVPMAVVALESLPVTPSGKLDRLSLPAPEFETESHAYTEPRTPTEEVVAGIWAEVLRLDRVSAEDNFFELGGHSLLATQVISRVRRRFHLDLPLRVMFEAPTVSSMAVQIEAAQRAAQGVQAPPVMPVSRDGKLPLSFGQQRLWFLDQLEPDSPLYNVPLSFRLRGALDVAALKRSLSELVRRHEILRTNIHTVDGEPTQVIRAGEPVALPLTDLSEIPEAGRELRARECAARAGAQPFHLDRDPLLRASLLRLAGQEYVLLLTLHHTVIDGWSAGLMLNELQKLYQGFSAGKPIHLPDLPLQYADYAAWQREYMEGEALEKQLAHWRKQLAGIPSSLELPTARARPAMQTFQGADEFRIIPREVLDGLRKLGMEQGCTLFMTLLGAFDVLLARYTGQEDIVVGSAIAGRNRAEFENLIGFFINTLVLRTDLSGNPKFQELLGRVRETSIRAYAHQEVPFEKLVEELSPARDPSRTPLFQVMFALQNAPAAAEAVGGIAFEPFGVQNRVAKFDLTVTLTEKPEGLRANFSYNTALFDGSTIVRMLEHFENLLQGIVADPEKPISELPLMDESERHHILVDWNQTGRPHPHADVAKLFEASVRKNPDSVAVAFGDRQLTYRELNRRANWVAAELRKRKVGPEMLVGICMERSLEMIIGVVGILKAGGAYLPLDPAYPKDRLDFMLRDAGARFVLTTSDLAPALPHEAAECIAIDSNAREQIGTDQNVRSGATLDTVAYVMYTSGSTGKPKGVAVPHRGIVRLLFEGGYIRLDGSQVILHLATLSFDASTFEIWGALLHGGKCVLFPGRIPTTSQLGEIIRTHGVSAIFLTTALFNALIDEAPEALSGVKQLLFGGEKCSVQHVRRAMELLRNTRISHVYGPTECTTFATHYPLVKEIPAGASSVPIGKPIGNTQLYVLDQHRNPVPAGVCGELYIGGDGLAVGYLSQPELTAEKFVCNPFSDDPKSRLYRTGDLVRHLADGNIDFVGRTDHQVKIRGFRIEPGEVEAILHTFSEVREVLVMAREDVPGIKRLVAYIVPQQEHPDLVSHLRTQLKEKLPEHMVPSAFVLLREMPLSMTGKVNRQALPAPEYGHQEGAGALAPRDHFEVMLVEIWEKLLGVHPVGVTDNFFELGGHSLLAVRLMAEIQKAAGKEIPLATLFKDATIEYLASILRGQARPAEQMAQEIQAGTAGKTPFFAIVTPGVNALGYVALARHLGEDQPFYRIQKLGPRVQGRPYSPQEFDELANGYVAALKTAQPEGPYLLGGMCEGARIAFDMARKLESSGDRVALLAIFDTWVVENTQNRALWYLYYYSQRIKTNRSLAAGERWAEIRKALRTLRGRLFNRRGVAENLWRAAYWPGKNFVPPKFGGTITVFKLRKQPYYYVRDPLMGWGIRTRAGVETREISGKHTLILREPDVQSLAKELRAVIDRLAEKETRMAMDLPLHGNIGCEFSGHEFVAAEPQSALSELTASAADAPRARESANSELTEALEPGLAETPNSACPLSVQQRRLWVLSKLENAGSAHNVPVLLHLHGELDRSALQRSLDALLARNPVLRSRLIMDGETPSRFVFNDRSVVTHTVNLSQMGAKQRSETTLELAGEALEISFDLEHDLLLRACLFQLGAREHLLSLVTHQAVCDSASASILARELISFYAGFVENRDPGLSSSADYADYTARQEEYRKSNRGAEDLAYWKDQLAGCNGGVELPADFPRPAVQSFAGGQHSLLLEGELLSRARQLSRREGVSVFEFLLAAFFSLLARYSALDDIIVGSEVSSLDHPAAEGLIGCYSNQLVLRADLSGDPTFREILNRIKNVWAGASGHQDAPFADVIRQFDLDRDLSKNPLFQVMFTHESAAPELPLTHNLRAELVPPPRCAETLDLSVRVSEREDRIELRFSYSTDLFAASTIARMASHYRVLLGAGSKNPELRLSKLPLLMAAEREQLLVEWNHTTASHPATCIQQFFQEQASRTPNAAALIFEQQRMNYVELEIRSNRLAHYLRKRGVASDVLVGICCERTPDLIVGMLAILKAGGAYVPLDPNYPKERLQAILEDARAPLLLTQEHLVEVLPKSSAQVICLDKDWSAIAAEPAAKLESHGSPNDLAYVLFTSGSTGRPKGVAIEHRSASVFIQWAKSVFSPDDLAGVLFSTSVCFDLSIFELFVTLSVGGKVVMAQDVLRLPGLPAAEQVTLINTVPSAMAELLRMAGVPDTVRVVNLAGEALTRALADQIYALGTVERVYNLYGPTEDTTYSTFTLVADDQTPITIGKPITNSQAYVLDSHLEPVPVGVPGELYLGGQGLARGYYGRPDLTAERFIHDPFSQTPGARLYRTGDLVRFLPDGNLEYLGRIDHQVKLRGFRIEMGEIESVLASHPAVRQSVVMLREDIPGDKRLVAYVTSAGEQNVEAEELRLWLKEKLPEFMVPANIVALESLPLTMNGKIDRRALPSPQRESRDQSRIVAPRNETEALLVSVFQSILGVEVVGITDDFFDLGGHSLMAARLVSEVQTITGKHLPLSALFHGATPEFLALVLQKGVELHSEPIAMAIQPGNGAPAFFCVVPPGENAVGYVKLARHAGAGYPFYRLQGSGRGIGDRPYSASEIQALANRYVEAMRAVQPSGPYYFGGMCYGAHIACRMARTLNQQGERVGMLAVFDTWVLENTQKRILWYVHYYSQRLHAFVHLSGRERMRAAFKAFRSAVSRARGGERSIWSQAYWPGDSFEQPTFSGKVALFKRPKQPFYYVDDPEMGWGRRALSGVDVQVLPIDHEEMLHEPYVRILARRLADRLQNYFEAAGEGQPDRDQEAYATVASATHHEVS
jgi:amino acid adenylation domain-containing protein